MKLIDILNKIANGELKEGTKVKYKDIDLIYEDEELVDDDGFSAADFFRSKADYNEEVELIEPQEPTDNTKIEELDIKNICDIFLEGDAYREIITIRMLLTKLNEVIRYINK
jgi:hypothetical protein